MHSGRWKGFPQVDSRMLSELRLLSKGLTALATGEGLLAPVHSLVELHGGLPGKDLATLGTLERILLTEKPPVLSEV